MNHPTHSTSWHLAAKLSALLGAAFLGGPCAWADAADLRTQSGHSLGVSLSAYHYDEPGYMSLKSRQIGLEYAGTYALGGTWPRSNEGWFVRGELRVSSGKADYRSPISGSLDGTANGYLEARGLLGRDFDMGGYTLAPYVGLGLRRLNNDLRGVYSTGLSGGYRRSSEYTSLPIGLTHRVKLQDQSVLDTNVEYMHLISGLQKASLSDSSPLFSDLSLKQRRGHGLRLNIMSRRDAWSWGPTLTYWKLATSEPGGTPAYVEPKNTTYELGFKAAYHF